MSLQGVLCIFGLLLEVFISLVKDVPMIMSEIANVFKKNQVSDWIVQAAASNRVTPNVGKHHPGADRSLSRVLSLPRLPNMA